MLMCEQFDAHLKKELNMEQKAQSLIHQLKEIKDRKKITYNDIMNSLPQENGIPVVSFATVRRVFAKGSEFHANSFNYENTLLPISEAIKRIDGSMDNLPQSEIIMLLREQIEEKDDLIQRLIDRLDQKDEIIKQFLRIMEANANCDHSEN